MEQKNNNVIIAGAIIIAGFLIALGIFASKDGGSGATTTGNEIPEARIEIEDVQADDHIRGNRDARVTLIEFSDIECPFCQQFHGEVKATQANFSPEEFAWVYRHFPLEQIHPSARPYARATECVATLAGEEAFWTYLDTLIAQAQNGEVNAAQMTTLATQNGVTAAAFNTCVAGDESNEKVQEDLDAALAAGAQGTPYSVFIVDEEIGDDTRAEILSIVGDPRLISISEDGTRLSVAAALPQAPLTAVVTALLGEE